MPRRKQSHTYQPRKAIPLGRGKTQHEDGMEYGRMLTAPEVAAYRVIGATQPKHLADDIDVPGLLATLRDHAKAVSSGDLSRVEASLTNQADALQSLFVGMVERGLRQEYHAHVESFLRLALKAQSQCRTTLETLVNIKNPPFVYAHQANVTTGPQQVNNGVWPNLARETEMSQTQLSGAAHELRQDTRASGAASAIDSSLEAVASVDGAKNGGGKASVSNAGL
jgi:hypothetical protein